MREGRPAAPELGEPPLSPPKPIGKAHRRGAVRLPVRGGGTSARTLRPSREAAAAARAEVGLALRLRVGRPGREPLHVGGAALEEGGGDHKTLMIIIIIIIILVLPVAQKGSPAPTP